MTDALAEKRFSRLVCDLEVDTDRYDRDLQRLAPPERKYVILFSARSGSSWLTSVLSHTKVLGYPEEYLNPNFIRDVARAQNAREPRPLLDMLSRKRKTANGIFGIEVRHVDIELFGEECFLEFFDEATIFFHLWRSNIVAQGISLFRAVETDRFHSTSAVGSAQPPSYDADGIRRWIKHVAGTENGNAEFLRRTRRAARGLCYEEIVAHRNDTVECFLKVLGASLEEADDVAAIADEHQKIGDTWNVETEERFREENSDFVSSIEEARMTPSGMVFRRRADDIAPPRAPPVGCLAACVDGKRAGSSGQPLTVNPYPEGTDVWTYWRHGWNTGWDTQTFLKSDSPRTRR